MKYDIQILVSEANTGNWDSILVRRMHWCPIQHMLLYTKNV